MTTAAVIHKLSSRTAEIMECEKKVIKPGDELQKKYILEITRENAK